MAEFSARCRLIAVALALCLVAACGPRGAITVAPEAAEVGSVQPILVATSRGFPGALGAAPRERSDQLSFARFDVSVPPDREPGTVAFPELLPPDPRTDFLTVSAERIRNERAFVAAVNAAGAGQPAPEAMVFVHGYNTNFAEGVYRQAQMRHDFGRDTVAVHYAWPSAGEMRSYAFDSDSALFARDGLERLLNALTRTDLARVVVVGHSMGAKVVMETLRQMAIRGSPALFRKLHAVVLISPDLDADLFRTQLAAIGRLDISVYVFVSGRDRALRASSFIRGQRERVGSIGSASSLADLPITVIDIGRLDRADLGHFKVATSPSLIALLSGMREVGVTVFEEEARSPNLFETSISVVQEVTEIVLRPLTR